MTRTYGKFFFGGEFIAIMLVCVSGLLTMIDFFPLRYIVDFQLVVYLLIVGFNYLRVRSFNFYQIWVLSYIFIVWSEMCIISARPYESGYLIPFARFTLSNFAVLLGYQFYQYSPNKSSKIYYINKTNKQQLFTFTVVVLYALFVTLSAQSAISNFYNGRQLSLTKGGTTLSGTLLSALGTLLPVIIAYQEKYKKGRNTVLSFIYSLPIFIIVLLQATRFKFLFSVMPFLIVTDILSFGHVDKKKNIILFFILILLVGISSFIKEYRNMAFSEIETSALLSGGGVNSNDALTLKMAKNMSPEGVVMMAYIADNYFATNSLHWGKEMSFILFFWVPRSVWPNKPTQLDYWLIRASSSESVSDTFSSASGFIGEARADFGWGCLIFSFLLGMLLKRIDVYKRLVFMLYKDSFNIVLISILVPWAFFFVRSPITSTMSLFWEVIIYIFIVKLFSSTISNKIYHA